MTTTARVTNFGANVSFTPQSVYAPRSEAELLEIMARHAQSRFRVVGRTHAWSPLIESSEVLLDLRHLDQVTVEASVTQNDSMTRNDSVTQPTAWVGAGCQIKHILEKLAAAGDWMLPALGLITEQALAGAMSTGTHGSGRHSLSHYALEVRIAGFDAITGQPVIRTVSDPRELRAARCALGLLGVIVAIKLPIRRQFQVEEFFYRYTDLEQVLAQEAEYPLQQFYMVPYRWDFFAQQRRESTLPRSWSAPLYRLFWSVGMDRIFHWMLMACGRRYLPQFCNYWFFRAVMPCLLPQNWRVVDRADRQLIMEHELYRHIETEIFVTRGDLRAALDVTIWLLKRFSGEQASAPACWSENPVCDVMTSEVEAAAGTYFQHYVICVRKVLPDDTLISMAAGTEPYYAISLISYELPERRAGYFEFARIWATALYELYAGRPHWGKYCPLPAVTLSQLYPRWSEFVAIAKKYDPPGQFANAWLRNSLKEMPHLAGYGGDNLEISTI
ncbi:MAG: D-arabinono-1,4-lactone oxidase [Pirellulales bacterium]|nr:D-arabinono-1,4-lactone oxidase [Pirellulales bacterium]